MHDLISVIVPIYNVEKYLKRCIESILKQTYKNLEIILVDDGSTDNCTKICDEYKKKDNRIIVVHKLNGGLSDARNKGLDIAKGKYVTFIDSDDFVTEDYVEILLKVLKKNNADISIAINKLYFDNGKTKHLFNVKRKKNFTKNNYEMLINMLYLKDFSTSACSKLFKRSLFDNIRFPFGKLYEDAGTIYKVFLKAKRISYLNEEIYFYYQRTNSIVGSPFSKRDMDLIDLTQIMLEELIKEDDQKNLNGELKKAVITSFLGANFHILRRTHMKKEWNEYNKRCIENIKKYKQFDKKARLKHNIAIIIFTISPKLLANL